MDIPIYREEYMIQGGNKGGANGGKDDGKDGIIKPVRKCSTRKYICPNCNMSVRATKYVYIICGNCMEVMEVSE